MTNQYHATPYDISATGFYFSSFEEYQAKAKTHKNAYGEPVEEYEIQFIDGENYELFNALGINQANLKRWFDDFENLDGDDLIRTIYVAEYLGYTDFDDILKAAEDICLFEGTAKDYAENYIEDTGLLNDIPENLRTYFDIEAFARDLLMGGEISEVTVCGTDYVAWGG